MPEQVYILTSDGELCHWGIKGMKWGVRRYQNRDGTLTAAGKKRIASEITSRKISTIEASKLAKNAIGSDPELDAWRSSDAYKNALRAKKEYVEAREKYIDANDRVWRKVVRDVEKKYGPYEDLERRKDTAGMDKFNKEYYPLLDKRLKDAGVDKLEKIRNSKREELSIARKEFQKETHKFVNTYMGKYGDEPLKGQGSAIYYGRRIVDRLDVTDIFIEAYSRIDGIGMDVKDWYRPYQP